MNKKEEPVFYGGQAVMEGVMMRGKKAYAMAVRSPSGEIKMIERPIKQSNKKFSLFKLPVFRGIAAFGRSMYMGYSALAESAEIAFEGLEEPKSKFEIYLTKKFGDKLNNIIMIFAMIVAIVFAIGLFMLLPTFLSGVLGLADGPFGGVFEGILRIILFITYVFLVSFSKDVRRTFEYHGAEHKAINCHEQGLSLTPENIKACSKLHKRCGTSFMLIVMVLTMLLFMFLRIDDIWLRLGSRILILPVIAGLAYEISVKWAGKRDNFLVRAIIFPGMCLQKITTSEPDESQIEIALSALKAVLAQEENEA